MSCIPCGSSGGPIVQMQSMAQTYPRPDGTFSLFAYPDCEGGYRGPLEGRNVYVVARGRADERLFPTEQLAEAAAYMNSLADRPQIEKLAAVTLCQQAIEAVYAVSPAT